MTRFDEITRLKELEKKAKYDRVEHGAPFRACAARAAPWLLGAAACFQPGDARCVKAIMGIMRAATGPETDSDELDCLRRLQKAAEIMEELE